MIPQHLVDFIVNYVNVLIGLFPHELFQWNVSNPVRVVHVESGSILHSPQCVRKGFKVIMYTFA